MTTTATAPILAKVTKSGASWRSRYIRPGVSAYRMETIDSTRTAYGEVTEIEVRPATGGGWDVVLCGDVVDHHRTKTDAQWAAVSLLDNPRDAAGWLIKTTRTR